MAEQVSVNISMPEAMRRSMDERMAAGQFGNVSEYIRHLVREDLSRASEDRLEKLLLEGLDSGPGRVVDEKWWKERRAELEERARREAKR